MGAVLVAFFSALVHPIYPLFAKKAAHPWTINVWAMTLTVLGLSPFFLESTFWERVMDHWPLILAGLVFHVSYILLSLTLIARHEFQVLYPLTRLAPILILIGEILLFQQDFSLWQIVGIVSVALGALMFSLDHKISHVRWYVLGGILLVAGFVTGFHLTDKKLLETFTPLEVWALVIFQLPVLWWFVRDKVAALKQDFLRWKQLLAYTIFGFLGWYAALWAMQFLAAAVVFSIRNLSIVFGIWLGGNHFDEGHRKERYIAAALIIVGAGMAALL